MLGSTAAARSRRCSGSAGSRTRWVTYGGAAGRARRSAAGDHHHHRQRQAAAGGLGRVRPRQGCWPRGSRPVQRQGRAADPHLRRDPAPRRCCRGWSRGGGGELPQYASENYRIDKICDYAAAIEVNTKVVDNPGRKAANAMFCAAEKVLAAEREAYAEMLADPATDGGQKRGANPSRAEEDRQGREGRGRRQGRPRPDPRQAPGERHRPVRAGRGATRRAAGLYRAAAARAQRRALARHPPQRIPA